MSADGMALPVREARGDTLGRLTSLFREVNDLKRTRVAGRSGSIMEQAFRRSWARLLAGQDAASVALSETAALVAAARLGGLDRPVLEKGGLSPAEVTSVLVRGLDEFATVLDTKQAEAMRAALTADMAVDALPPAFVALLERQPRAGATKPGTGRLVLEPPESHADHCMAVAALGVLLCPAFDARIALPFLAGLSHHLHNAFMPDAGFTGEMLLGDDLEPVMRRFTAMALAELPPALSAHVVESHALIGNAASAEAKAFNAADVLDRVLQQAHYARAASFTLADALEEMELVHAGPLQAFQNDVLRQAGLT